MSSPIIQVAHLGKEYRLSLGSGSGNGLRHVIEDFIRNPFGKARQERTESFWALKDVSFELEKGEVLGVIGRNGAGKSTLLKILSRITEPTKGSIRLGGRISSLLEVGTGFHPELSGRENIFLNGAILGMSRVEIKKKFDEIVAFAEVEKFIDTPVKRYSSGMYVRLAFAVAAHLEPEILIVDEVLAVGDAAFQKKCLGKMKDVSTSEGRTIIFVSHNIVAMTSLCSCGIVLQKGRMVVPPSPITEAAKLYFESLGDAQDESRGEIKSPTGKGNVVITNVQLVDGDGNASPNITIGRPFGIRISYRCVTREVQGFIFGLSITPLGANYKTYLASELTDTRFPRVQEEGSVICRVEKCSFYPGAYTLNASIKNEEGIIEDWITNTLQFKVEGTDFYGTGKLPPPTHQGMLLEQRWSHE